MSKRVKALIEKDYQSRLGHVVSVAVINPRGIDANSTNQLRAVLAEKGVKMTVVKNTLVKRASTELSVNGFEELLDGPSALVYGAPPAEGEEGVAISTVCRALVDHFEGDDDVELRGVFFDGEIFHGADGVKRVSKFPTREEAIADVLGAVLGAGSNLIGAVAGPGGSLGGLIAAIEDKAE
ncbi:MAG: 50S ribosomal protein L10 [Planctomycetota bacterium]